MNWHRLMEERSFEMHQVIAGILREHPEKLELVRSWIEERLADSDYSVHSKDSFSEWLEIIIDGGVDRVLEVLADRGEEGCRLRHSTPFAVIMPQDKRMEILKRYEALRPRAHLASV